MGADLEISAQAEPPSRQSSSEGSSKPRTRFSPSAGGCLQLQRVYRLFAPSLPAPRCIGNFSHGCGAAWGEVFYFFFCGVGPCLRAGDCGTLRGPAGLWVLQVLHGFSLLLRLFSCFISPPAEHEGRPQAAVLPTPAQPPVPIAVASGLCPARPEQPGDPQRGSTVAGAPLRRYK